MEFRARIKQLRVGANLSTTQLANIFGKSEAAVRAWEAGRTKPDADTLIEIAAYFDCTTDFLLGLSAYKNAAAQTHQTEQLAMLGEELNACSLDEQEALFLIISDLIAGYKTLAFDDHAKFEYISNITAIIGMLMCITRIISPLENRKGDAPIPDDLLREMIATISGTKINCQFRIAKLIDAIISRIPGHDKLSEREISLLAQYDLDRQVERITKHYNETGVVSFANEPLERLGASARNSKPDDEP